MNDQDLSHVPAATLLQRLEAAERALAQADLEETRPAGDRRLRLREALRSQNAVRAELLRRLQPAEASQPERGATREERQQMDVEHAAAARRFLADLEVNPEEPGAEFWVPAPDEAPIAYDRHGRPRVPDLAPPTRAGHLVCGIAADLWPH
jgi:hypothetical protein